MGSGPPRAEGPVRGLDKEELEEPIGNMLNHNLIRALMASATLTPADLALLDGWD